MHTNFKKVKNLVISNLGKVAVALGKAGIVQRVCFQAEELANVSL